MAGFTKHPEVVCTELEEGAVLLNMETRLYYSLNETGLELWRAVGATRSTEDLARVLKNRFEIDDAEAEPTASRFLQNLEHERLVVPADGQTAEPSSHDPAAPSGESGEKRPFVEPQVLKHDEPLHEVSISPFDPQLPLAE